MTGKECARLFEKHGWELKRIKGSLHVYVKVGIPARISVPIHANKHQKIGLMKHLMRIAGIVEEEL